MNRPPLGANGAIHTLSRKGLQPPNKWPNDPVVRPSQTIGGNSLLDNMMNKSVKFGAEANAGARDVNGELMEEEVVSGGAK